MFCSVADFLGCLLRVRANGATCSRKCQLDIVVCFVQNPQRKPDPQRIEEDQVYPEIHEVTGVQIWATDQPFRCEGHEACHAQSVMPELHYIYRLFRSNNGRLMNSPPYNSPVANTLAQNHNLPALSFFLTNSQIHSAKGPPANTVSSSKLMTVRSAPPHLLSAFAYSCQSFAVALVPY